MQKVGSESKALIICQYFHVYKAKHFQYHVIKYVVQQTGIVDSTDLCSTNVTECMRKKLKNYSVDLHDYTDKTVSEKQELRKKFVNIIVDRKRFDEVLKLQSEKMLSRK